MTTCFACWEQRELPFKLPRGELNRGERICQECAAVVTGNKRLPPLPKGAALKILQGEDE